MSDDKIGRIEFGPPMTTEERTRYLIEKHRGSLSLLGRSSEQEARENKLRVELAESQVKCEQAEALIRALLAPFVPGGSEGTPADYEQGICWWCGEGVTPTSAERRNGIWNYDHALHAGRHKPGCAYVAALEAVGGTKGEE